MAAAQPVAATVAGAAGGPSSCRGECSASPSGLAEETGRAQGCEALPPLPPPFSRRPAAPSGHGADGRARGGVAAAAAWTWRSEAAGGWVRVGAARPGCTRRPRGPRRRETMRCGAARRGCDWTYPTGTGAGGPAARGGKGSPLTSRGNQRSNISGSLGFAVPAPVPSTPIFRKGVQCRDLKRRGTFCVFFRIKQAKQLLHCC